MRKNIIAVVPPSWNPQKAAPAMPNVVHCDVHWHCLGRIYQSIYVLSKKFQNLAIDFFKYMTI